MAQLRPERVEPDGEHRGRRRRVALDGGYGAPCASRPYHVRFGRALAGRAVDIVTRIRFSRHRARGRVDVWLDGRRRITDFYPPAGTLYPVAGSTAYLKTGLYRDPAIRGSGTVLLDDLTVSRTFGDA